MSPFPVFAKSTADAKSSRHKDDYAAHMLKDNLPLVLEANAMAGTAVASGHAHGFVKGRTQPVLRVKRNLGSQLGC